MRRRHLFEFHERARCPAFIRESIVETLGNGLSWGHLSAQLQPAFDAFCAQARPTNVLELCSGSGRPLADLAVRRGDGVAPTTFTLSDLFPNHHALRSAQKRAPQRLRVSERPVDATRVGDFVVHDARMMINAFHHFAPDQARAVLEDCAASGKSVFIFEGAPRGLRSFIVLALNNPWMLVALFTNPFLAKENVWLKIIFTYLLPIIPLAFLWDSVISNMRIYDRRELAQLVSAISSYEWTYQEVPFGRGARAQAFFGVHKDSSHTDSSHTPLQG